MEKILVIGAGGQIGVELTLALRERYGNDNVIATDIKNVHPLLENNGPYFRLDVMNAEAIDQMVSEQKITQVYLLAAILSATGEKNPLWAWNINMTSLLSVLNVCVKYKVQKVFWPSSIAIFGASTPKENTPQHTIVEPSTVYGISKYAGELWIKYYNEHFGLDIRSIRYPGIISWKNEPGGGTTDYAIEIYIEALKNNKYTCFLSEDTALPMMYMDDAIRATIELMDAPKENLSINMSYNLAGMTFTPAEIAQSIQKKMPDFQISYEPDFRQKIAASWPQSIDDSIARKDWNWQPQFDLDKMTEEMLQQLSAKLAKT